MHNKVFHNLVFLSSFAFALSAIATNSRADTSDGAVGLTYSKGFHDVVSWHEDHLAVQTDEIPVGLSYRFIRNLDSGLRLDVGIGPIAIFTGDVDYYDVPLQLTGGYSLFKGSSFRPYIRGGLSYHINDGDYVESSAGLGLIGAVGVEIGRRGHVNFFAEASVDTAEATFSTNEGNAVYVTSFSKEDIEIAGVQFTAGIGF